MNIWTIATGAAIWTLIAGSLAVFGWFLVGVLRLVRAGAAHRAPDDPSKREGRTPRPLE